MTDEFEGATRHTPLPIIDQIALAVVLVIGSFFVAQYINSLLLYLYYLAVLCIVTWTDLRERRIPNRIVYPAILVALGAGIEQPGWPTSLFGGLATGALFLVPVLIFGSQRAGIGDEHHHIGGAL